MRVARFSGRVLWVAAFCLFCLWTGSVSAAEGKVTVTGTVAATQDDDGNVTGVTITTDGDETYNVTLDAQGKALAKLDGKKVEATGAVKERDDEKWLTVAKFAEVKPKAAPKADEGGDEGGAE